jgi:hypothetical protein
MADYTVSGSGEAGARECSWPPEAGAWGRDAAVSATALAGRGRARDGRGCGEWRNGRGRETGASWDRHRRRTSSQRRRELHASSRLLPHSSLLSALLWRESSSMSDQVTTPAPTGRPTRSVPSRKSDFRDGPVPSSLREPHVPSVSWRPGQAVAATRRPGRISDGRCGPDPGRRIQRLVALKPPSRRLGSADEI